MKKLLIKESFETLVWGINNNIKTSVLVKFQKGDVWKIDQEDLFYFQEHLLISVALANNTWIEEIHTDLIELIGDSKISKNEDK